MNTIQKWALATCPLGVIVSMFLNFLLISENHHKALLVDQWHESATKWENLATIWEGQANHLVATTTRAVEVAKQWRDRAEGHAIEQPRKGLLLENFKHEGTWWANTVSTNAWVTFNQPQEPSYIGKIQSGVDEFLMLQFQGKVIVQINHDGSVTIPTGGDIDEASCQFWRAVADLAGRHL